MYNAYHTSWHIIKRETCLRAPHLDVNRRELEAWFDYQAFSSFICFFPITISGECYFCPVLRIIKLTLQEVK